MNISKACRGCIVKNTSCPDEFYELCLRCLESEKEEKEMKSQHEELVRQIREAGESLIKNAESIAGNEKYLDVLNIKVYLNPKVCNPSITIEREFTPEQYVERVTKKDYAF